MHASLRVGSACPSDEATITAGNGAAFGQFTCSMYPRVKCQFPNQILFDPGQTALIELGGLSVSMSKLRRQSQRRPIMMMLIVLSLLWSQFALAIHGAHCSGPASAMASAEANAHHGKSCESDTDRATCAKHCGEPQSDQVSGLAKLPFVPALVPSSVVTLACMAASERAFAPTTRTAVHHGPTGHPAPILLI